MSTPQNSPARSALIWILPIAILVIAGILIMFSQNNKTSASDAPAPSQTQESAEGTDPAVPAPSEEEVTYEEYAEHLSQNRGPDVARRSEQDLAVGPLDAPVVMVVYSDFQCSFCALWTKQTLPVLIDNYVDTDQLRIEWRDVSVFGESSRNGAIAARAAFEQDKFWEMHGALFPDGKILSAKELTPEALTVLAGELGLDTDQFAADMTSDAVLAAVEADEEEGRQVGATATPSFLINGIPVRGAQPLDLFVAVLDTELALVL